MHVLECRAERAYLTKWDDKMLHVPLAKREIESFRVGRAHWGIALFPPNCGLESFIGLVVFPQVCVSVSKCTYVFQYVLESACYISVCLPSVEHSTRNTL